MRSFVKVTGAILLGSCCSLQSLADDVRHPNVPAALHGTWATSTELCSQQQKTVTLSDKRYTDGQSACEVSWVEERAASPGTIYSAHMLCRMTGDTAGTPKPTNLVLWVREPGRVSIGPSLNELAVNSRCP